MNDASPGLAVLLVEDSATDAKLIAHELRRLKRSVALERVETGPALRAALERQDWDVILSDWSLPNFSAAGALAIATELRADVPFIIVSGTIGEEAAVDAMHAGARDYVLKDKLARLTPAVERELLGRAARIARREAEAALRQSEEQLRQAQKMEAVGRLAGGVAHDFNNLLSVILSYSEMMQGDLEPTDPLRMDLQQIHEAATRAGELTRQLLLFSRQQVTEPRVIDLDEVVTRLSKMVQRVVGEDIDLAIVPFGGRTRVKADPTLIEQVLLNLVVNARDAMPRGGKLTIETNAVTLDGDYAAAHLGVKPGQYVVLVVSDTGMGMSAEVQSRIFEPFFTTKEKGKGTGLGLSTVFGIVQQSGGHIAVESAVGHGTTFTICLPRVDGEVTVAPAAASSQVLQGTETLLLVEDEPQVRAIAESILRRQGYQVIVAQNPGHAVQICGNDDRSIDLLLTDVVMPQMSGPELARRLAPLRPGMKVLYMSGYTDDSALRHGVVEGGVAFLQKPITPAVLSRKVREVLDSPAPCGREPGPGPATEM